MHLLELEFLLGPRKGERIAVKTDFVCFGRTEHADVPMAWDPLVSSHHFVIRVEDGYHVVEDLQSRNGTFLNAKRIQKAILQDGDHIGAGSTVLQVSVLEKPTVDETWVLRELFDRRLAEQLRSKTTESKNSHKPIDAAYEELMPQVVRLSGQWPGDCPDASWMTRFAGEGESLHAIVDPNRARCMSDWLSKVDGETTICDWIVGPAKRTSPKLFSEQAFDWTSALQEAWDRDAVVVLSSKLDGQELMARVRDLVRERTGQSRSPSILGVFWPSILQSIFQAKQQEWIDKFLQIAHLVLIEQPREPGKWQLFGTKPTDARLVNEWKVRLQRTAKTP